MVQDSCPSEDKMLLIKEKIVCFLYSTNSMIGSSQGGE